MISSRIFLSYICLSMMFSVVSWAKKMEFPGDSIYQIQSEWKDHSGKTVQLKDYSGQKIVLGMVYTKCPHACPMTIAKIMEIEKEFIRLNIKDYKIVLASFDIERDTPGHLGTYHKSKKLSDKWVFLSADKESKARELAAVLGINYKKLEDGEFSHSNIISLLDLNGVVLAQVKSLKAENKPILEKIKQH